MRTRANVSVALALATAALAALAPSAQAVTQPKPALKLLSLSAPTNLPLKQSEVQRVTVVGAEGGAFRLLRKSGEGSATPVTTAGVLKVEKGNPEATISSGSYEVGDRLTAAGVLASETIILSCSPDCTTTGSIVTLSKSPESPASGTASKVVKIFTKQLGSATGSFHVGDILSGPGIATGTEVIKVEGTTLTTTKATTSAYSTGSIALTITEPTEPIPFDASSEELQAALDAMPAFAPGSFKASGGPGGNVENPYSIVFAGPLAEQQVEGFTVDGSGLLGEHPSAHVTTPVPGGPGTGVIVVLPANIGAKATNGKVTVNVGPLPGGIVTAGPAKGTQWECPGSAAGQSSVTCFTTRALPKLAASAYPINVPIGVQSNVPFNSDVETEISGGGSTSPDRYEVPIVASNEEAHFSLAAIWAGAYEADGTPTTQAGGHPYSAASYFMVATTRTENGRIVPTADSHETIVDLQPGFVGNPMATARCPQVVPTEPEHGGSELCNKQNNAVGYLAPYIGSVEGSGTFEEVPLYNNVPPTGYAAAFTTLLVKPLQTVLAQVRSESDYGVRLDAPNNANFDKLFGAFAAFEGVPAAGHGTPVISTPTDCAEEARQQPVVRFKSDSWQERGLFSEAPAIEVPAVENCAALEFKPIDPETGKGQVGFSFDPSSANGSSPVGATAHLHIDQAGLASAEKLATPHLKRSVIKLPEGFDLNPSSANGLEACSEAQIGYLGKGFELPNPIRFNEEQPTCPDGSKLGTVEVGTPLLENPLVGTVFLAAQEENPFGSLLAIYLVVNDPRTGVIMKLPGEVQTNPVTGQLTTVFDFSPQLPFEDLYLHFRGGGPQSQFATPEVCGTYTSEGEWTPWSAPESGPPAQTKGSFAVNSGCASSAGSRPFSPSFEAGTQSSLAGAYSPLVIKVGRKDGEQELKSLDFTLPPGVTGKLAGIPYCSEAQIVEAEHKTGRQEQANSSCPTASELGTVDTSAGVGSEPFHVQGHVYLAGPYKGAPLSSVVVTPAVAGPLDLGDVVVRAPIYVNPETAQLTAKSDPIPTILKGIPLKVRSVTIDIDRSQFSLNPTS
ncbi:MAG TPA: hypothetical protein VHU86_04335, partial [Solirubrobacterales bacterium]|nr:hypothetical protein [Solirubrobacterales bacterium]